MHKLFTPLAALVLAFHIHHFAFGQWTVFNQANSGIPINETNCIGATNSGDIYCGTPLQSVGYYNGTSWSQIDNTTTGFPALTNDINTIYTDGSFVGVCTHFGGVGEYSGSSWSTKTKSSTLNGLADDEVNVMAKDANGYRWYATFSGLSVDSIIKWRTYKTSNSVGMPGNDIRALAIDQFNNKWVGITNQGLARFTTANVWTLYSSSNSPLPSNLIHKITIAPNGKIWICTDNGLAEFDGNSGWTIHNTGSNPQISSNLFNDIVFDNTGKLYAATTAGMLMKASTGDWVRLDASNSNLPSNNITGIVNNTLSNTIWVSTADAGVAYISKTTLDVGAAYAIVQGSLVAYPNPVENELSLDFILTSPISSLTIELESTTGQQLYSSTTNQSAGFVHYSIPFEQLSPGMYLLKINTNKDVITKRILKL